MKGKRQNRKTTENYDPIEAEEWIEKDRKEKEENHSSSITNKKEEQQKINRLENEIKYDSNKYI